MDATNLSTLQPILHISNEENVDGNNWPEVNPGVGGFTGGTGKFIILYSGKMKYISILFWIFRYCNHSKGFKRIFQCCMETKKHTIGC